MRPTTAVQKFTPMIKFLGKRTIPKNIDHTPKVHPLSGTKELPRSFYTSSSAKPASQSSTTSSNPNAVNSIFELPAKFRTPGLSEAELEQVNSGAAEIIY